MARAHKGWIVNPKGGGFLGRARDPKRETYKSKMFPTRAEAEAWATMEHARLMTGLSLSGRAPIDDLLSRYEMEWARLGHSERAGVEVMRILRSAVAAGVNNLLHPNVRDHARAWLAGLRTVKKDRAGRPLKANTVNRHLRVLRSFANWCVVEDVIPHSPFQGIKAIPIPDTLKAVFTVDEAARMTDPGRLTPDGYGMVLALQLYAGLRTGEALNMRWECIDFRAKVIKVRDWKGMPGSGWPVWCLKMGKERDIPLQPELADLLKPYAQLQGWVSNDAFRLLHASSQRYLLKRWCKACGVTRGPRTPHSTRHTWISLMLASGENQMQVRDWAGHSSLDTTDGYARNQTAYREDVRGWQRGIIRFRTQKVIEASLATANE